MGVTGGTVCTGGRGAERRTVLSTLGTGGALRSLSDSGCVSSLLRDVSVSIAPLDSDSSRRGRDRLGTGDLRLCP